MLQRIGALAALALLAAACSSTPTTAPLGTGTAQPGAGGTETAGATQGARTNPPPAAGDLASLARRLAPPGSTELSATEEAGGFTLLVSSTLSIPELESFWDQKIPTLGMYVLHKIPTAHGVVYELTNPVGEIIARPGATGGPAISIFLKSG